MRIAAIRSGLIGSLLVLAMARGGELTAWQEDAAMGLKIGGAGGVYVLAEPGELRVQVFKQDRNRREVRTHLRALLVGPDRSVVGEAWLADDGVGKGAPGEPQNVVFTVQVPAKGVYALNITVSEDRYGNETWWGFRTNGAKFLVETSRGHRDRRHEEPIQVANPDTAGDICFQPEPNGFEIEATGLVPDCAPLELYDAAGNRVATLVPDGERKAVAAIPADPARGRQPWRLHLPSFQATVQIDGVTRWRAGDLSPNLSLWTPDPASWFAFHENRWLLTPYSRTLYGRTGDSQELTFTVENQALQEREFALRLEHSGAPWPVELGADRVRVPARGSVPVTVRATLPPAGDRHVCRVRIEPLDGSGFSTYSGIEFRRGPAPVASPLPIPLDLKPYQHENEQFGYLPEYPLGNQVYFDLENRPFVATGEGLWARREGSWQLTPWQATSNRGEERVRLRASKIAFDAENRVYVLGSLGSQAALLYSTDGGRTLAAAPIPGGGTFDIEQFSGHNVPAGPPPFIRIVRTAKDEKLIWRSLNDLDLFVPRWENGAVVVGEPVRLSTLCIGLSHHSGIPSSLVSRGDKVHVAWGEATDPEEKVPGVPTYVATYDRRTGVLGASQLVGYGPPANDVHNTPCIAIDGQGYLHVLVGTHGRAFRYSRSLVPNDASGGWTPDEEVGAGLRQTYVGLVCDPDDTLHLVFRLWLDHGERFPAGHYASLARMSKRPGEPWSEAIPLILAPFSEYSIFYHRLTIDRRGRLFLSYDYWSTFWFYRNDHRGDRRALILSPDAGTTWKLVANPDFDRQ